MVTLQAGMKAPEFEAKDSKGNIISLKNYAGKKVIIYFYPKDDTPGCTAEACNIRDNYSELIENGYAVIGVSADSVKSHENFINKYELPFPLIPDVDKKIINAYGAWGEKQNYGKTYEGILRKTVIISEDGKIEKIIAKVNTKEHVAQIFSEPEG